MDVVAVIVVVVSLLVLLPYLFLHGRDSPFVPVRGYLVERVMELAEIGPGDVFYDLGSGDGRLVVAAALRGAKAYGVEINPWRVWYSRLMIGVLGLSSKAKIIESDLFRVDLKHATVVSVYLVPKTNERLKVKLKRELGKKARVLSIGFPIEGLRLVKEDRVGVSFGPTRLYKVSRS